MSFLAVHLIAGPLCPTLPVSVPTDPFLSDNTDEAVDWYSHWTHAAKDYLEHCIASWVYSDGQLSTSNTCNDVVGIRFRVMGDQRVIVRHLKPREVFRTASSGIGWWMFTACPVGYVNSVPFLPGNRKQIMGSRYNCVRE